MELPNLFFDLHQLARTAEGLKAKISIFGKLNSSDAILLDLSVLCLSSDLG